MGALRNLFYFFYSASLMVLLTLSLTAQAADLPVNADKLESQFEEIKYRSINNLVTLKTLQDAVGSAGEEGLPVDLTGIKKLLDGTEINPAHIYGRIYYGPYPFEAWETNYAYKRFRLSTAVKGGKADLGLKNFFRDKSNSEGWTDRGRICLRFDLYLEQEGADRHIGLHDIFVNFEKNQAGFLKSPSLVEGPFAGLIHSGNPGQATIVFQTDRPTRAAVVLDGKKSIPSKQKGDRHEVLLTGLKPDSDYWYQVEIDGVLSRPYHLKTAPRPGQGEIIFAYTGDSREGVGPGTLAYMGLNYDTLEKLMNEAYTMGSDFFIMGGDLVNGYTTSPEDFAAQLQAWKQAVTGLWNGRPVYPAIGNHETLLKNFDDGSSYGVSLDRWPYETDSAEAVFAREFFNPTNGPAPADPRRPSYKENVFSFQYGPVLCIAFNNNYWASYRSDEYGGSPEGYIMPDQMEWIEKELERAEKDKTIKYILLYAQEPVFPNGGHIDDAMWWGGDNNVRAHTYTGGKLIPEEKGMIEVRNQFARLAAKSPKVAAVLGSDEHAYHRVLISREVPIGDVARDDKNNDGKINWPDEKASPLQDLKHPVWYLVSGGGGAPYYAHEDAPWNVYWQEKKPKNYYYSSQENILLFKAGKDGISVRVYNPYGEVLDEIENLMTIKK